MMTRASPRLYDRYRALGGDESGVVAIEFALLTTLFFLVVCVALDFGAFYLERSKIGGAVSGAAVAAFDNADSVDFAVLPSHVRALANDPDLTVTTACNGATSSCSNTTRNCACIKNDGGFAATSCGAICTGAGVTAGSRAGYYLTISATRQFSPVIVPRSLLEGAAITQVATVRLQ